MEPSSGSSTHTELAQAIEAALESIGKGKNGSRRFTVDEKTYEVRRRGKHVFLTVRE
jgi:hypothetical protein